ncbi:hypothetical protein JCM1841_000259 [Sporobolomyces salmonicolor]
MAQHQLPAEFAFLAQGFERPLLDDERVPTCWFNATAAALLATVVGQASLRSNSLHHDERFGLSVLQQHDAHELLTHLLNTLKSSHSVLSASATVACRITRRCACGTESVTNDVSWGLSIEPVTTITDGIEMLNEDETFECHCSSCGRQFSNRRQELLNTQELLLIRIRLEDAGGRKRTTLMDFESGLEVLGTSYELKAVICHHGESIHAGHYVTIVPTTDGATVFDDNHTRSFSSVSHAVSHLETDPYIFAYEIKDTGQTSTSASDSSRQDTSSNTSVAPTTPTTGIPSFEEPSCEALLRGNRTSSSADASYPALIFTRATSSRHIVSTTACVDLAEEAIARAIKAGIIEEGDEAISSLRFGSGMQGPSEWTWHSTVPLDNQPLVGAKRVMSGECSQIILQGLTAITTNICLLSAFLSLLQPAMPFIVLFSTNDVVSHPAGDIVEALNTLIDRYSHRPELCSTDFSTSSLSIKALGAYVSLLEELNDTVRAVDSPQDLAIRLCLEDLSRKIRGGLTVAVNIAADEAKRPTDTRRRAVFGSKLVEIICAAKGLKPGDTGRHRHKAAAEPGTPDHVVTGVDIDSSYPNHIRQSIPRSAVDPPLLPVIARTHVCSATVENGELCGKVFSSAQNLARHELSHSISPENTPFRCDYCGATFRGPDSLRVHNQMGSCFRRRLLEQAAAKGGTGTGSSKNDTSPIAALRAAKSGRVPRSEKASIPTDVCKLPAPVQDAKKKVDIPPPGPDGRYPCDQCQRSFSTSTSFKTHKPCFENGIRYACKDPSCDRVFMSSPALGLHTRLQHPKNEEDWVKLKERRQKYDAESKKRKREKEDAEDLAKHGRKRDRKKHGSDGAKICSRKSCGATTSPQWLKGPGGEILCNACALQLRRTGMIDGKAYETPDEGPKYLARKDKGTKRS